MGQGRPVNENRQAAIVLGDAIYEGSVHTKCGTSTRYVKGMGCVHCAREKQAAIRAAARGEPAEPQIEEEPLGDELDKLPADEVEPTAFEDAIDELM